MERNSYDLVLTDMNYSRDTTSGEEGLELVASIRRRMGGSPMAQLIPAVARAAEEHSRGEQGDDMTLLGLRALPV